MSRLLAASLAAATLVLGACGGSPNGGQMAVAGMGAMARASASNGHYVQRNLVSDQEGKAEHQDKNLVNAWGIAHLPTSPWWVADNEPGVSTLYDQDGVALPLVVNVTGDSGPAAPTGAVSNTTEAFVVSKGGASGAALFLFASEDGTISGWNPEVPPPPAGKRSTETIIGVNHAADGNIYKGLALAQTASGPRLYATDFHHAKVDVFDGSFAPVTLPAGAFEDPDIPAGFAPFGIQEIDGKIVVTYAKQDDQAEDDVKGPHLGFVDGYSADGELLRRIATEGKLDAPWGVALAPSNFGEFSGRLLVGNFGDGHLIAYKLDDDDKHGEDQGQYVTTKGGRITIDGLWGIAFGNDSQAGPSNTLFFAAGPDDESHGLFGRIDFVPNENGNGNGNGQGGDDHGHDQGGDDHGDDHGNDG